MFNRSQDCDYYLYERSEGRDKFIGCVENSWDEVCVTEDSVLFWISSCNTLWVISSSRGFIQQQGNKWRRRVSSLYCYNFFIVRRVVNIKSLFLAKHRTSIYIVLIEQSMYYATNINVNLCQFRCVWRRL